MHERGTQLLLVVSTLKSQCKPKERTACLSNEHAKLYRKFLGRHEATFGELVVGDEAGAWSSRLAWRSRVLVVSERKESCRLSRLLRGVMITVTALCMIDCTCMDSF